MRSLFITAAAGAVLVLALPAAAQTTPPPSSSGPPGSGSHGQSGQQAGDAGQVRQKLKQDLEQAGFKNVQVMPESFLVRAQDKQGRPVLMVVNPDSVTAITEVGGGGAAGSAGGGTAAGGHGSGSGTGTAK